MSIRLPRHREPDMRRVTQFTPDFSGGIDATAPHHLLGYTQYRAGVNATVDEHNVIRKRPGFTRLVSGNVTASQKHMRGVLTTKGIAVWSYGDRLFSRGLNPGRTLYTVASGIPTAMTFLPMARWNDDVWFSANGYGIRRAVFTNDSTPPTVTTSTAAYNARFMAVRRASERLFVIDADKPYYVRWSSVFGADDVTPTWDAGAVLYGEGQHFRALAEMGDVFVLAQTDQLWRIDGTTPASWRVTKVPSDGIGCVAQETMKVLHGVCVFLSAEGVAYFDGTRPRIISGPVKDFMPTKPDFWMESFAVVDGERYILFLSSSGGMARNAPVGCDYALAWNFRKNTWEGPWRFANRYTVGTMLTAATPQLTDPVVDVIPRMMLGGHGAAYAGQEGWVWTQSFDDLGRQRFVDGTIGGDAAPYSLDVTTRAYSPGTSGVLSDQDEQAREIRVAYRAYADTQITVNLHTEGDATSPIQSHVRNVSAGEGVLTAAVHNLPRRRNFFAKVSASVPADLEIRSVAVDFYRVDHG